MNYNIVNEIKIAYTRKGNCEKKITSSKDAVEVFRQHFDSDEIDYRESFYALYLNQTNNVLGIKKISECGISSTMVVAGLIVVMVLMGISHTFQIPELDGLASIIVGLILVFVSFKAEAY
jgi:DNA repair protein RadC